MPDCPICGKPYKSRSGLATHRKTHDHEPHIRLPLELAAAGMPGPVVRVPASVEADLVAAYFLDPAHHDKALAAALKGLDIDPADVLSSKVYPDQVVIIAGPTGKKLFWTREV